MYGTFCHARENNAIWKNTKGILQNHTCTHSPSYSCETIILRDRRRVIIAIFTTAT